jgi:hypothetical protein
MRELAKEALSESFYDGCMKAAAAYDTLAEMAEKVLDQKDEE